MAQALGPARTVEEHLRDVIAFHARRIKADPLDAYAYSARASCYDHLHDRANANADMRRWSAAASGRLPGDFRRVIDLPLNCELVFSAERPVNTIPTMSVAFGQKGRCEMKLFEIPMVAMSLFGFGLWPGLDVPAAHADFTFGAPVNIQSTFPLLNPGGYIDCFSADGLEMYIESNRAGGQGGYDLWVCKRASPEDDWGPPENLGATINSAREDICSSISGDGLELYFHSDRPGGYAVYDIYMTKRATRTSPWGPATNLGPKVNSPYPQCYACVLSDGLELYFASGAKRGGYGAMDLFVSRRATASDPWGDAVNLGPAVNSPGNDVCPGRSPDGLLLFFVSDRPGGYGNNDIWMTRRASRSAPWELAVNLGPMVNGPNWDEAPFLAPDGSALYFLRNATTWKAPILPIVDFNGDGKVDGKEVLALAEHWGQSHHSFDIKPLLGDGIVDANDLTVLAGYIGQDVNDPTLIAHWALDETEGMTAADSAGDNDAIVVNVAWQPTGGQIGGALAFNGKNSLGQSKQPVLDPAKGPFSAIAWVKGGAAGGVIVSQALGANWLYLNQYGMLTTDVKSSGNAGKSLTSDAHVLDDQWHRVALTWDGTNRTLQMDGVEVARDTQPDLAAASGKVLYLGSGKTGGAFWSGLIDEVRIYNRAVQP